MSLKPEIITAEKVSEQTLKLLRNVKELELQIKLLERKLAATERSLVENETLRTVVKKMLEDNMALTQAEWDRRKTLYPDIRLGILTKVAELITPTKKDKGSADSKTRA